MKKIVADLRKGTELVPTDPSKTMFYFSKERMELMKKYQDNQNKS